MIPDTVSTEVDDIDIARLSILQYLCQAGVVLDRLWLSAADAGDDDAVRLAEASQAVHRAVMSLAA